MNGLDQVARQSLEKIANDVRDLWESYIETRFYDQYSPKVYKRTYALLNSVVVSEIYKSGNKWMINIFMDESTAQGYKDIEIGEAWTLAAAGSHGGFITTEGRFYDELLADLNSGRFYNDFEMILKGMGLRLIRR